jgi:ribosomal protein S18 acetylase RimI-like enzyme
MTIGIIRQLTVNDFEAWKAIRLEGVKLPPQSCGESFEQVQEQNSQSFEELLKRGAAFALEKENIIKGIIGTFTLQPHNMRHRAVLFGLYVRPDYRESGVANALVEHVINFVKPLHTQIHLTVTISNNPAINLYKKHGFIIYGLEPSSLKIGEDYYDGYLMVKKL